MNNLQTFRKQVQNFLNSPQIQSASQWQQLMQHLCDLKILHPKEVKNLNQNTEKRTFPITIPEFEEIIMREFGDEANKKLLGDLNHIQKQIRQSKGVLAVWKDQGLSSSEIKALEIIFAKGNNKMKQICSLLREKKQLLEGISEQEVQMIKAMDEWTVMQNLKIQYKDYEQYQQTNQKAIEHLYAQLRVRQVHFRTKKLPNSKTSEEKIVTVVGYNSKTDAPVQVTKIPKKMVDFQEINTALITFNAQRDLMLSPYFLRFLGYNTSMDSQNYLYFREHLQTKNIHQLLKSSTIPLEEHMPLFQFWAGEVFRAIKDLFYMSSYVPVLPIQLADFEVADYGLKVVLKHCKFDASREPNYDIQCDLLENIGTLIMNLLGSDSMDDLQQKVKNIENRCLLTALTHAKTGKDRYQQKITPCYINFYNAQTHPLFESNQQKQGMDIIDNFTVLFSDQL